LSLLDTTEHFEVATIAEVLSALHNLEGVVRAKRHEVGEIPVPDEMRPGLSAQLQAAADVCSDMKLIDCVSIVELTSTRMTSPDLTLGMLETEFAHARLGIIRELRRWYFVPVDPERTQELENALLFGTDVHAAFDGAWKDITEAGSCLAVGLPTAAVFHLMRVAEHGLRALARKMRVKVLHKGRTHPVEFADWETIIAAIKTRIEITRKLQKGPKRKLRLERYSDAADHCTYMKDIWRNDISHTGKQYLHSEACVVLDRVRDFMQFIVAGMMAV
jgi:hypothetical protein